MRGNRHCASAKTAHDGDFAEWCGRNRSVLRRETRTKRWVGKEGCGVRMNSRNKVDRGTVGAQWL